MSQENVELAQQAFDAFNRRDMGAFLALMDADVEAVSRLVAMEGGYHGHDGIRHWWQNLLDAFPDYTVETVEARELGNLTLATLRGRGHGADSDTPFVDTVWVVSTGVTRRPSDGASCQRRPKPSKPWGCGTRRCRRNAKVVLGSRWMFSRS